MDHKSVNFSTEVWKNSKIFLTLLFVLREIRKLNGSGGRVVGLGSGHRRVQSLQPTSAKRARRVAAVLAR